MNSEPLRILVADDESPMRQALSFILESAGHTVTAVDDGGYALQQLLAPGKDGEEYDLLITDLLMPHMPGLDLISLLTQRNIYMPVIVISGCNDKKTMIQLIRKGCNDFLEKPFTPEEVVERVDEVMHKWRRKKEQELEREEQLQEQLHHLRKLLHGYEKRLADLLPSQQAHDASALPSAVDLSVEPGDSGDSVIVSGEPVDRWTTADLAEVAEAERSGIGSVRSDCLPLVEAQREGEWLVLTPQAYLSDDYTPEFCKILVAHLDAGESKFRFDLNRLTEIGSRVLAVFAAFAAVLRQKGSAAELEITLCSSEIAQLFRLTSLDRIYHLPSPVPAGN